MATDYTLGKIKVEFSSMGAESTKKDIGEVKSKIDSITKSLERFNQLDLSHITKISSDIKNIDFSNLGKINDITKNIDTKGINEFANALTKLQSINTSNFNLEGIMNVDLSGIAKVGETFKGIDAENMNKFANSLNKLQKLSFENLDIEKIQTRFADLATAVKPFVNELAKAENSLVAMNSVIKKVASGTKKASNNAKDLEKNSSKSQKNFSKLFSIGKLYFFLNYTKKIAQGIGGMVTKAIDFEETLNKFQVSMGSHYQQSLKFVNDLTNAFNLSRESIMNYQSTFKNMLDALGNLDTDVTYKLSETLTRMAIDYSSLYNVQIERAMEQFQGVLAGNIRSIRSTSGYDVSEQTIFNIYRGLGGTKTMRQLDQVEKRLLRIIALQQQMERTGAVGDFEKTMTNTSNVLKQIQDTLKEIGTWIGSIMKIWVAPLLEKVLGFLLAVKEIVKTLSILSGYQYEDFGSGGLFGDVEQGAEDAEDAVNSLKRVLLGFDQLNILGSSTSNEQLTTDYSFLTDKIKEYNSQLSQIENKYAKISEAILKWAGFTKNVETDIWEYTGSEKTESAIIEFIFTRINSITEKIFEGIGKVILGIVENLPNIVETLFNVLGNLNISLDNIITTLLNAILELIFGLLDNLPTIIDKLTFATQDISQRVSELIVELIGKIADNLPKIIEDVIQIVISLMKSTSVLTTDVIINIVENLISAIFLFIEGIIKAIPTAFENVDDVGVALVDILIGVLPKIIEALIRIVDQIFESVPKLIGTFFSTIFKEGTVGNIDLGSIFKAIIKAIGELIVSIIKFVSSLIVQIISLPFRLVSEFTGGSEEVDKTIDEVLESIDEFFTLANVLKKLGEIIRDMGHGVIQTFVDLGNFFKAIGTGIANFFKSIGSKLSQAGELVKPMINNFINRFKSFFQRIGDIFESIGEWFASVYNKIKDFIDGIFGFGKKDKKEEKTSNKSLSSVAPTLVSPTTNISTFTPTTASTTSGVSASNYSSANQQATNQNKMLTTLTNAVLSGTKQVVDSVNNSGNNPIYLDNAKVSEKVSGQLGKISYRNLRTIV